MNKYIHLIGLNHKTAGVSIRERYALSNVENFETSLLEHCPVSECVALSTCNRVEILCVSKTNTENIPQKIRTYWAQSCNGSVSELTENTYALNAVEAVSHIFTVASSLDSMIMGEPQILGQLKDAFRAAVTQKTTSVVLNRLLHKSFSVAKRVRTETAVASSAVSISFAAVELAKKIFGDLQGRRVMLIGAGEMAELAATHLLNNGIKQLVIANRTFARAKELAETMNGLPISFESFIEHLSEVDIVISSTGSPHAIIHARDIKPVLKARKNAPMFIIDIAVPRDIDPDVNQFDNVYLYDIDDLKEVVEENINQRQEEADKAKKLIAEETIIFQNWLQSLKLQPTIVDLHTKAEKLALRELQRTLRRIGPVNEETQKALETLVKSIAGKMLHDPVCFLRRRTAEDGSSEKAIDTARKMFNLDTLNLPHRAHCSKNIKGH